MAYMGGKYKDQWLNQALRDAFTRAKGHVLIRPAWGYRFHVVCPPHDKFIVEAVALRGRWRHKTRVWSFPNYNFEQVRALAIEVYGKSKVTIYLTNRKHSNKGYSSI